MTGVDWDIDRYYGRSMRLSTIGALLLVTASFIFLPKEFVITPYSLKRELTTIMEILPKEINKIAEPPVVERPKLPIAALRPEEVEKTTIDPTTKFPEITKKPAITEVPIVPFWIVEEKPRPEYIPQPPYPEVARLAGIEGQVVVEALVDVDGKIIDARVLKSSGNQALDEAAIRAARDARFTPAKQRDMLVRVWISIPFQFKLN
uniref:Energy transducer TonB n=1 Tax=candidate division WOR-3 bacterium TaxID=2052148 RepID=A0A7C6EA94_UNCW3